MTVMSTPSKCPSTPRRSSLDEANRFHPYAQGLVGHSRQADGVGASSMTLPSFPGAGRLHTPSGGSRRSSTNSADFDFSRYYSTAPGDRELPEPLVRDDMFMDLDVERYFFSPQPSRPLSRPPSRAQAHLNSYGEGYERRATSGSRPQPVQAAEVDRIAGSLGLDRASAAKIFAFSQLPLHLQVVELYGLLMSLQTEAANTRTSLTEQMDEISTKMNEMKSRFVENFQPSPQALEHMRKITRHYIVQPTRRYAMLHITTRDHYQNKSGQGLNTPSYATDPVVRDAIHSLLQPLAAQCRANLRKLVWRFTSRGTALDDWVTYMFDKYVYRKSSPFTKMMTARLALMRKVARPLIARQTKRGQDTGFWDEFGKQLEDLYKDHGDKLDTADWEKWADNVIAEDKQQYRNDSSGMNQPDEEEEDMPLPEDLSQT